MFLKQSATGFILMLNFTVIIMPSKAEMRCYKPVHWYMWVCLGSKCITQCCNCVVWPLYQSGLGVWPPSWWSGPGSPAGWPSIYVPSSWMWQHLWHVHSPGRFNLAPEALRFIDVELALSRQGSENVLLQPDGLCSVPTVCWLLSARDTSAGQGSVFFQNTVSCKNFRLKTMKKSDRKKHYSVKL